MFAMLFCSPISPTFAEEIRLVGTENGEAIFEAVCTEFQRLNPGIVVRVPESIDSGGGIKAVASDRARIARVARPLEAHEKGNDLVYVPFAKVQIAFFVNPGIRIDGLSAQQFADIYSGKIRNWQEVGNGDERVRVVRREEGDSAAETIEETLPGFDDIEMTAMSKTVFSDSEAIDIVERKNGAIGFGSYGLAKDANVSILHVDGLHPEAPDYPCAHPVGLVFKEKNKTGIIEKFIEFATSGAAHEAIRSAGGSPF
jgi:phosphate transport system substrate-binding protein